MRFGVVLPTQEIGSDPGVIRDFAQTVEGLGFDHLLAYDHVLGAARESREPPLTGPYDETDPFHEPLVLFGYLAAVTTRLELATGVLVLPQRQTALVAKQAVELDLLSQSRFRLAVGTGWNHVEYRALGVEFARRGARLSEQLQVLRELWRRPVVDFTGEFHRIDRAGLLPRPSGRIPLWCGGSSPPALRRAVQLADGFLWGSTRPAVFEQARLVPGLLAEAGRTASDFGLEAIVDASEGEGEWERRLRAFAEVGGTHFTFRTIGTAASWMGIEHPGYASVSQHLTAIERFARLIGH